MDDQEGTKATDLLWIVPFVVAGAIVAFWVYQGISMERGSTARVASAQQEELRRVEEEKSRKAEEEKRQRVMQIEEGKMLYEAATEMIKAQLKSPSTAVFSEVEHDVWWRDADVKELLAADVFARDYNIYSKLKQKHQDGLLLWFRGKVDAQNTFGATVRSKWFCALFYSAKDKVIEHISSNIN
jgi:hypothetical protein